MIMLMKSSDVRDKWFNENGQLRETLRDEFNEVLADVMKEQQKYIKASSRTYTDWIVQ